MARGREALNLFHFSLFLTFDKSSSPRAYMAKDLSVSIEGAGPKCGQSVITGKPSVTSCLGASSCPAA